MSSKLIEFDESAKIRWRIVSQLLISNDQWWAELFAAGAFIAGGAALFVAEKTQCVRDVGDIDIWWPDSNASLSRCVSRMIDYFVDDAVDYVWWAHGSILTVVRSTMRVQFIRIRPTRPEVFINRFDLDYVQVAICPFQYIDEDATVTAGLGILVTDAAEKSWESRYTRWNKNSKSWRPLRSDDVTTLIKRVQKAGKKGFNVHPSNSERPQRCVHLCGSSHRLGGYEEHFAALEPNIRLGEVELDEFDDRYYADHPAELVRQ